MTPDPKTPDPKTPDPKTPDPKTSRPALGTTTRLRDQVRGTPPSDPAATVHRVTRRLLD